MASTNRRVGFAAMPADRHREICRLGGAAVPAHKRSWSKDSAAASEAGRKGGRLSKYTGAPSARRRQEETV